MIVAPSNSVDEYLGFPVIKMPSLYLKKFGDVRFAIPINKVNQQIFDYRPDVIHLASPALMGYYVARRAQLMNIPTIGVFQTDIAGFAKHYGFGLTQSTIWRWVSRIHRTVDRTLAPSTKSVTDLRNLAVSNVHLWRRGVNKTLFNPDRRVANKWGTNKRIVGYVGRLAHEKRVSDLATLANREDVQLVIVGDGPARAELETQLPNAIFTGFLNGIELAETLASFDCFIHTGPNETFCQSVQEALASGVPTIAVNKGGPLDLVQHGKNGFLIDTSNSQLLNLAVTLILHPTNWSKFSENALQSVTGRSWNSIMSQLMGHYEEVISYRADLEDVVA